MLSQTTDDRKIKENLYHGLNFQTWLLIGMAIYVFIILLSAAHADDTVYVLSSTSDMRSTKSDLRMSEIFLDVWTSFAVNGVPLVKNVDWKPVSREISAPHEFVHIRHPTDVRVEKSEDLSNGDFWRSLPIGENEKLFPEKNCKHDKSD